jgi:three-Cys-motif partner protein
MDKTDKAEETPRQVRKWSCHKLECLADFIEIFTAAIPDGYHYLETYAGCGRCTCAGTGCIVEDSSLRALQNNGFAGYILITGDGPDASCLTRLTASYDTASVIAGNPVNERVLQQAFDLIPRSASSLAVIDPGGYIRLRWSTIKKLAAHGRDWKDHKTELLIVFPLEMSLLRNITRPECALSVTRLYGHQRWQRIKQDRLEEKITLDEARQQLVALYKEGLKELGYRNVADFKPPFFTRLSPYHIISASDSNNRVKMLEEAWGKSRYLPCELLYSRKDDAR